ncbi:MAG TPA: hypothetical protein VGO48_18050 [Conexibacter sp.]|nr:hypothetical protein [Conexibacter sp.]
MTSTTVLEPLLPLVGTWELEPVFEDALPSELRGRTSFEWMEGKRFLVQRWEVPVPEAPDGLAVIGLGEGRDAPYLQHYFDTRGVARIYEMSFENGLWQLWRRTPDFSPLEFHQRFSGRFSEDGMTIDGRWELSEDEGTSWRHDFGLRYLKRS